VAFHKVLPVSESSLEAMKAQLVRAQAEAAASKSKHEESDKCITEASRLWMEIPVRLPLWEEVHGKWWSLFMYYTMLLCAL
jgi:hypothetical protein